MSQGQLTTDIQQTGELTPTPEATDLRKLQQLRDTVDQAVSEALKFPKIALLLAYNTPEWDGTRKEALAKFTALFKAVSPLGEEPLLRKVQTGFSFELKNASLDVLAAARELVDALFDLNRVCGSGVGVRSELDATDTFQKLADKAEIVLKKWIVANVEK